MSTLCVQVQPNRATGINMERVRTLSETIAANKELVTRFDVVQAFGGKGLPESFISEK